MHSTSIAVAVALLAAAHARAKIIEIDVGKGGLVFSSNSTTAAVGDTLEFHFFGSFHTAVQGDFSKPCQRASGGFSSGHINNKADGTPSVFQVTVKDTNPIWFYCSTPSHCQSGMAGVINPPAGGSDTLAVYQTNAAGTTSESSGSVAGGQVVPVGTLPSTAAAGSASSSTAPASSTAASSTAATVASTVSSGSGSGSSSSTPAVAATTTATAAGTGTSAVSASSSASAAATSAKSSGASGSWGGMFVAQAGPTLAGVVVGLGFLVYFMV